MSKNFDVCIYGDGAVGRVLALKLAQARLRVALLARAASPAALAAPADVRAYALNAASRELLLGLRAWPDAASTPVLCMQVSGDDGGQIDFNTAGQAAPTTASPLAWIVDVQALQHQLAEAIRYQPQIELLTHTADTPSPAIKAPLKVICEGQFGEHLSALPARRTVKPYPQRAVAARLSSTQPHGHVARQWFTNGEVLALLPLHDNALALIWSVDSERAEALMQLPADEFCAVLQTACGASADIGTLGLNGDRASWPLNLSTAERWVGPGWALAGDAAHTIHPLAGQGLNLGLADAACLADILAGREYWRALGDERLLRRYERARKADVATLTAVTDGLYSLFSHSNGPLQAARNWGMKGVALSGPLKQWLTRRAAGY